MDEVIREYGKVPAKKRVELICRYYSRIDSMANSFVNGMVWSIMEEQTCQRRRNREKLGVLVQGRGGHSDPTGNTVVTKSMLEQAIFNCDFSGGILDGMSNYEQIASDALAVHMLKREYDLFCSQLGYLNEDDQVLLLDYLKREKSMAEISEEKCIQYKSACVKIGRLKQGVKEIVLRRLDKQMRKTAFTIAPCMKE